MIRFTMACAPIAIVTAGLMSPAASYAQQITTLIQGRVTDAAGAPLKGANVVVTDTRTNSTCKFTTESDVNFSAIGLTTGGPYVVTATAAGFPGQPLEAIFTTVSAATNRTFNLAAESGAIADDTIVQADGFGLDCFLAAL